MVTAISKTYGTLRNFIVKNLPGCRVVVDPDDAEAVVHQARRLLGVEALPIGGVVVRPVDKHECEVVVVGEVVVVVAVCRRPAGRRRTGSGTTSTCCT